DFDGQLRPAGRAWAGHLDLRSAEGGVRNSERARNDLLGYSDLRLEADFSPARIEATLATVFNGNGHIRARIATGWDAASPLSGEISADTDELTWLELFSPDIVEPTGRLTAELALGGRRNQPALGGQARLSGFSTELPSLGILLESGEVALQAQEDGSASISGSVASGGGTLAIDGSLNWRDTGAPLLLRLTGEDVVASNTRDLRIVANPEIEVRYTAGQPLSVSGTVTVPSALIDLERLDGGV